MTGTSRSGEEARFRRAMARIDQCNRQDPQGREYPHALAVVRWIEALRPDASRALRLAGRGAHLERWRIPRDRYPLNRRGYLSWRRELQAFHAERTAGILTDCGYPEPFIGRVRSMILKRNLQSDPETRTLEDALCLVFMERQLDEFRRQHDDGKLQRIITMTWAKMSAAGRAAALELTLPPPVRALLERSLGSQQ